MGAASERVKGAIGGGAVDRQSVAGVRGGAIREGAEETVSDRDEGVSGQ